MYKNELYHHGIKGMKWGVRRFQTKDGGLTSAGRKRYSDGDSGKYVTVRRGIKNANVARKAAIKQSIRDMNNSPKKHTLYQYNKAANKAGDAAAKDSIRKDKAYNKQLRAEKKAAANTPEAIAKRKKALKVGAAVAGTALAAYGAYKASEAIKDKAFKTAYERGTKATSEYMKKYNSSIFSEAISSGSEMTKDRAMRKSAQLATNLDIDNRRYAKNASKNTVAAIKTLAGKNKGATAAELLSKGYMPEGYNYYDLLENARKYAK